MADETKVTKMWEDYQHAQAYQTSIDLRSDIPTLVKMYEGDQQTPIDDDTATFPRPIINLMKMVLDMKVSSIVSSSIALKFTSDLYPNQAKKFTKFTNYILKKLRFDEVKEKLLKEGAKKGTYILHVFYNDDLAGKRGNYSGGLELDIVDPLNFYVSNPRETDVQKQKWIMFDTRESVEKVKADADEKIRNQIKPDSLESAYNEQEQQGSNLCTVLTKYFRIDGEVYYQKAVKNVVLHEPRPINPDTIIKTLDEEDSESANVPTETIKTNDSGFIANLYPVEVGVWEEKDKSMYGISELKPLLYNQKAINHLMAFSLYAVQQNAQGTVVTKEDALKGQEITNEMGQIITDFSKHEQGIYKLPETHLSNMPLELFNLYFEKLRTVSGATEVMTGDISANQASGYMVSLIQEQAKKPLENSQKSLHRFAERLGKVLEMFFKIYFDEQEFTYELTKEELKERNNALEKAGKPIPDYEVARDTFKRSEYMDIDFDVIVEASATNKYNELMLIQQLEMLFNKQAISFEEYVRLAPKSILPNKEDYEEVIKDRQEGQIAQLTQIAQQQQQQVQALQQQLKQAASYNQNLQKEFTEKINIQNEELNRMKQFMKGIPEQKPDMSNSKEK